MSTSQEGLVVKQDLNSPRRDVVEELKELLGALPASLAELERAEEMIREGVLKLGRRMLQEWGERADSGSQRPCCEKCQQEMRHKGYSECTLATTLGDVHIRRVRFRCEACGQERYPQDAGLRFAGRSVTWRLAKVISRLGAQLPFEQAQQNLYEDYRVRVCKQTVQQVSEAAGGMLVEQEEAAPVAGRETSRRSADQRNQAEKGLYSGGRHDDSRRRGLARDPRGKRRGLGRGRENPGGAKSGSVPFLHRLRSSSRADGSACWLSSG